MKWAIAALAFNALISSSARADIVMVDLNLNDIEVAAARVAAAARKESLIVVPDLTSDERTRVAKLKSEIGALSAKISKVGDELYALDDELDKLDHGPKQEEVAKRIEAVRANWHALAKEQRGLTTEIKNIAASKLGSITKDLEKIFEVAPQKKQIISSLIISGHHTSDFYSEYGGLALNYEFLTDLLKKNPETIKSIASVYLWGCYSATHQRVAFWKKAIPDIKIVAGFDASAPSQVWNINPEFLTKTLVTEAQLVAIQDQKKLHSLFKQVKDIEQTCAVICVRDVYMTNSKIEDVSGMNCQPEKIRELREKASSGFWPYFKAIEPRYANPPKNTQRSELREIYSMARLMGHCEEARDVTYWTEQMVHLIFFDNVRKNFYNFKFEEVDEARKEIEKSGAPAELSLPDLSKDSLTRADLVSWLARAKKYRDEQFKIVLDKSAPPRNRLLNAIMPQVSPSDGAPKAVAFERGIRLIDRLLRLEHISSSYHEAPALTLTHRRDLGSTRMAPVGGQMGGGVIGGGTTGGGGIQR
jgi:hypothetical protein